MNKKEIFVIANEIYHNKNNEGRYLMMDLLPDVDPFIMNMNEVDGQVDKVSPYACLVDAVDSFIKELTTYSDLNSIDIVMNNKNDFLVTFNLSDEKNQSNSLLGFQVIDDTNILIDTPNHLFSLIKDNDGYNIYEYVVDDESFVPKKRVKKNG